MNRSRFLLRALLPTLSLLAVASYQPAQAAAEKAAPHEEKAAHEEPVVHEEKVVHEVKPGHEEKATHEEHPATAHAEERVSPSSPVNARAALQQLMDGNRRFTSGVMQHPDESAGRRRALAAGQKPFAIVLACADSRVPPNILFDEGLGSLFVIRIAGNVVDENVLGSIEYAVEHLGSRLIMVLGHSSCGAVKAAVDGGEVDGHIGHILEEIIPSVKRAKAQGGEADLLSRTVRMNVQRVVREVGDSQPILGKLSRDGRIQVVGGVYNLETGVVEIVADH